MVVSFGGPGTPPARGAMNDLRPAALVLAGASAAVAVWLCAWRGVAAGPEARLESAPTTADPTPEARCAGVDTRHATPSETVPDAARTEVAIPSSDPPLPVLVRGRVVDDLGVPVPGATVAVRMQRVVPLRGGSTSWQVFGAQGEIVESGIVRTLGDPDEIVSYAPLQMFGEATNVARPETSGVPGGIVIGERISVGSPWESGIQEGSVVFAFGSSEATTRSFEELLSVRIGGPSVTATTDAGGRFEICAQGFEPTLHVTASCDAHLDHRTEVGSLGADVLLTLQRAAILESTVLLPDWLPPDAIELTLTPGSGGDAVHADRDGAPEPGRVRLSVGGVPPGPYDLQVRVRGMPEPVFRVPDLSLVAGSRQPDTRATTIDLTLAVFRYEVRAVGRTGYLVDEPGSPVLVRVGDRGAWAAFPWREGVVEIFAPRAALDVVVLAPGCRPLCRTIHPGESTLRLLPVQPVEVVLPGLRALCGQDRRVRISMVKQDGTDLPTSIRAIDPRTGEAQSYSRWHLGMSGGAWLGPSDTVQVPLVLDGRYEVIVQLFEEGLGGAHSLAVAEADVALDGRARPRVDVVLDADRVRAGLEELRQRAGR